jgi:hypothetical protein
MTKWTFGVLLLLASMESQQVRVQQAASIVKVYEDRGNAIHVGDGSAQVATVLAISSNVSQ